MSVYTMDKLSLAKYLSDTKIYITPRVTGSTFGERYDRDNTRYAIDVAELHSVTFNPSIDVFVDGEGLLVQASIGSREIIAKTHEMSNAYKGYNDDDSGYRMLAFVFEFPYFSAKTRITNSELEKYPSYANFSDIVDHVVSWLEDEIASRLDFEEMNSIGRSTNQWHFRGIHLALDWDIRLHNC